MNFQKIRKIEDRISKYRQDLMKETEPKKKEILRLKIGIEEYKVKIERLKK